MIRRIFLGFLFTIISFFNLDASHLKGGWVSIEKIVGNQVTFRVNVISGNDTGWFYNFGSLNFGDGTRFEGDLDFQQYDAGFGNSVLFSELTHTYPASGNYTITFSAHGRDPVHNASVGHSDPFHITTTFLLDPFLSNDPPSFDLSYLFSAINGFQFNGALKSSDPEGDFFSYSLTVPKKSSIERISGYSLMGMNVERVSGNLTWPLHEMILSEGKYLFELSVAEHRLFDGDIIELSRTLIDFTISLDDLIKDGISASMNPNLCINDDMRLTLNPSENAFLHFDIPFYQLDGESASEVLNKTSWYSDTVLKFTLTETTKLFDYGFIGLYSENQSISKNVVYTKNCDVLTQLNTLITGLDISTSPALVFPNPSNGRFELILSRDASLVKILTLDGMEIFESSLTDHYLSLDLTEVGVSGIFIIQVFNKSTRLINIERLVITH